MENLSKLKMKNVSFHDNKILLHTAECKEGNFLWGYLLTVYPEYFLMLYMGKLRKSINYHIPTIILNLIVPIYLIFLNLL